MLVQLGVIALGLAVFELCAFIGTIWPAPPFLLLPAAVMVFVWMEVLRRSDDIAGRNKDALIGTFAKKQ
jgi:hypothetical protein